MVEELLELANGARPHYRRTGSGEFETFHAWTTPLTPSARVTA